jgi:hypothetical protein
VPGVAVLRGRSMVSPSSNCTLSGGDVTDPNDRTQPSSDTAMIFRISASRRTVPEFQH